MSDRKTNSNRSLPVIDSRSTSDVPPGDGSSGDGSPGNDAPGSTTNARNTSRNGFRWPWRWTRRIVQITTLVAVLVLIRWTAYQGPDDLPHYLSALFLINPLTTAAAMISSWSLTALAIPAVVLIVLTMILGRFFCGWVCPMGTTLDITGKAARIGKGTTDNRRFAKLHTIKYGLLAMVLVSSAMGLPIVGLLDPLAIFTRAVVLDGDPALYRATSGTFTVLYDHGGESVTSVSEPIYAWLKDNVLAFNQASFVWPGVWAGLLVVVILLERLESRFWCRHLCPLGAMLAIPARLTRMQRVPVKSCANCGKCADDCRMDAFDDAGRFRPDACNMCMDCHAECDKGLAKFKFVLWRKRRATTTAAADAAKTPVTPTPARRKTGPTFEPSRRVVLGAGVAGVALPLAAKASGISHGTPDTLLRPPGVDDGDDKAFLDLCVRCGQCMKVCPNHALQPTLLDAGLSGMFSPKLVPQMGYCEYSCNLCGQVCPTGAIPFLPVAEKEQFVIGKAVFDHSTCLPYQGVDCLVCEEHCPIWDKAIGYRTVTMTNREGETVQVDQPYVKFGKCVGCGVCEHVCPARPARGVHVIRTEAASAKRQAGQGHGGGGGGGRGGGQGRGGGGQRRGGHG